jgi:pyruvate,orthophosphate dikinase
VQALFEAACRLKGEGVDVHPEIMVAVTADSSEVKFMRELIAKVTAEIMEPLAARSNTRLAQ